MRRLGLLVVVLAALGAIAGGVAWFSTTVQDVIVRRTAASRAGRPARELLARDALRVLFCGTGSPLPDPDRGQPCTAVFANGRLFLIDAGSGSWERLQRFHVPSETLEGVLLTHFHSDHITGIPDVALNSWVAGRAAPLTLWGGPGVEDVARGFTLALAADSRYRRAHHGDDMLPEATGGLVPVRVDAPADGKPVVVLDDGAVRIEAFRVSHPPIDPAYGYRVAFGGRTVVVSGDTVPAASVEAAASGADVLVHEALAPRMLLAAADALEASGDARRARIIRDVPTYHTTPVDAARIANRARVALLVLTHLVPPVPTGLPERIFMRGVSDERPDGTILARDGLLVELPVDSREIRTSLR